MFSLQTIQSVQGYNTWTLWVHSFHLPTEERKLKHIRKKEERRRKREEGRRGMQSQQYFQPLRMSNHQGGCHSDIL
ncbi:MAG: hypothetical protein MUE44_07550 [Oscillatoriaceae cyanobacterium Prado104]|nr:hypothetical protein [Oscillatoriaceae cyanobacterium Prado104]